MSVKLLGAVVLLTSLVAAGPALATIPPPSIAAAFGATNVAVNGTTSLTFTITNGSSSSIDTGLSFNAVLPSGLNIASPSGLSSTCGGTPTATQGSPAMISLSGAILATSATCQVAVNVKGVSPGLNVLTTSPVTADGPLTGNSATASITVDAPAAPVPTLGEWALLLLAALLGGLGVAWMSVVRPSRPA
jgi:hypothetical protein